MTRDSTLDFGLCSSPCRFRLSEPFNFVRYVECGGGARLAEQRCEGKFSLDERGNAVLWLGEVDSGEGFYISVPLVMESLVEFLRAEYPGAPRRAYVEFFRQAAEEMLSRLHEWAPLPYMTLLEAPPGFPMQAGES